MSTAKRRRQQRVERFDFAAIIAVGHPGDQGELLFLQQRPAPLHGDYLAHILHRGAFQEAQKITPVLAAGERNPHRRTRHRPFPKVLRNPVMKGAVHRVADQPDENLGILMHLFRLTKRASFDKIKAALHKGAIDERLVPVFSLLIPVKDVLRRNRNWLILAAVIFAAGAFYAGLGATFQAELPADMENQFVELEQLFEIILNNPPLITASLVFTKNFAAMIQMLFFGALAGISPLATLFLNGYLLGVVAAAVKAGGGSVAGAIILGILPHGIFELSAFFLCGALGLKMGYHCIAAPLPGKTRLQSFKYIWKEVVSVIPLVTILLLGAALIEIFVTSRLVGLN